METPIAAVDLTAPPQVPETKQKKMPTANFFVITCLVLMLFLVIFNIFYISDLGRDILMQFEAAAETIPLPSAPVDQPIKQKITVEVSRSSLLSADYLAVVLPVLITAAGAFIVFLGMNRLKMYDERIDSVRSSLLVDLDTMVKNQVAASQADQNEKIISDLSKQRKEFNAEVSAAAAELANLTSKHTQEISEAGSGFEWLKAVVQQNDIDLSNVYTVCDAHKLVETLRSERPKDYISLIHKIVNRVTTETLSGDSSDYHNLAAELARGSLYKEACQVLTKGLELFPSDTDLLPDSINYATRGGMLNEAKTTMETLLRIDRRLWTWRCYSFCCDHYIADGELEKALEMCNACIDAFPTDQHGYHDKSKVVKMLTPGQKGINDSIDVLRSAVNANINCPQCSNALGEIYLELGQYEDALQSFNRTVLDLAISQPGINESYVFYNRGSCYDRMFIRSLNNDDGNMKYLINAHNDYVTAINLGELSFITASQARNRLQFLKRYHPDQAKA